MLDNPEQTTKLLTAMTAALSFEVELTPDVIAYLRAQRIATNVKPMQMVAKVSYAGDDVLRPLATEDGHEKSPRMAVWR